MAGSLALRVALQIAVLYCCRELGKLAMRSLAIHVNYVLDFNGLHGSPTRATRLADLPHWSMLMCQRREGSSFQSRAARTDGGAPSTVVGLVLFVYKTSAVQPPSYTRMRKLNSRSRSPTQLLGF
jgi:hypothetical protein